MARSHPLITVRLRHGVAWLAPDTTGDAPLRDWVERLLSAAMQGRVLKRDNRSEVRLVEHAGQRWIVKRYFLPRPKQILYQSLRLSPAWREWRGARLLAGAGIRASVPVAVVREGIGGGELLVLPFAPGRPLGQIISADRDGGPMTAARREQRLRLAAALGAQAGAIIAAGLVNRDHKPANLIVPHDLVGDPTPVIIDPLGVRRLRDGGAGARMLALLGRCIVEIGPITPREAAICLRRFLAAKRPGERVTRARRRRLMHDIRGAWNPRR